MSVQTNNLFNHLPSYSKVWIYQSNQRISDSDIENIRTDVKQFILGWTAHSEKVIADGDVLFNYFVVLVADENAVKVSGCSIDSSVRFVQQLEEKYNLIFFDRFYSTFVLNNEVKGADKNSFQNLIDEGTVNSDTLVFNNLIQTANQLQDEWLIPVKKSWHNNFFNCTILK